MRTFLATLILLALSCPVMAGEGDTPDILGFYPGMSRREANDIIKNGVETKQWRERENNGEYCRVEVHETLAENEGVRYEVRSV